MTVLYFFVLSLSLYSDICLLPSLLRRAFFSGSCHQRLLTLLSERLTQESDFKHRTHTLIEDIVNSIQNGHIDLPLMVKFLHAFGSEITFGYHAHLRLSTLYGVASAYHGAEHAIAAELAVSRHK